MRGRAGRPRIPARPRVLPGVRRELLVILVFRCRRAVNPSGVGRQELGL